MLCFVTLKCCDVTADININGNVSFFALRNICLCLLAFFLYGSQPMLISNSFEKYQHSDPNSDLYEVVKRVIVR